MEAPDLYQSLILIGVGFIAGFMNTVAGGGSLVSLPILIFMDLPPNVANASNRVALFFQNVFAVTGFKSKGISTWPYSLYLTITAVLGALVGAKISVDLPPRLFTQILSVVMIAVVIITLIDPLIKKKKGVERLGKKHQIIGAIMFFGVGLYGGFIQAGIGFVIIAILSTVNHMGLVRINSTKVFVILFYTLGALVVFIIEDVINWQWGLTLAIGNSTGGWIASRWQVGKGEKWIRWITFVVVVSLAIRLWFFSD